MGIKKLNKFLNINCKNDTTKVHFSQLFSKKIAVDIMIYIYKYAAEKSIIEGFHLLCSLFKKYNITPIFVFDGKIPTEKDITIEKRREKRKSSQLEYDKLINQDNINIRNNKIKNRLLILKRNSIRLKNEDISNVKSLIEAFGYNYIIAPGEADKMCAELVISNQAYACISEDTDMFVYGCPKILRYFNLFNEICVLYDLKVILNKLKIDLHDFKNMCVLAGCDYNETVINIFKCYNYYLKYKKKERKITFVEWINKLKANYKIDGNIVNMYKCEKINKISIKNNTYDKEKICEILKLDNFIFA